MEWSTALPDWEERLIAGKSLVPCKPLFPEEAEAALAIFKGLRIVDARNSPTMGEACQQWVFDFVGAIFGAYDAQTGVRLINDFLLLISKKNSKSTIAAGIMITALLRNWRQSAELMILAPTIEVAGNSWKPATDMVKHDPKLRDLLHIVENKRLIAHRTTAAELKVVAADTQTVSGKKASFILVDEKWIFGKMPNVDNMLAEATGGLASRDEGFKVSLSTHSDEPPAGVWKDDLERFRAIRDGRLVAPRSMGVMYEWSERLVKEKAYTKPENFYMTNPNLGKSVSMSFLTDELAKAEQTGQKALTIFYAKHLNLEVGIGLHANRWPGAEFWKRQADKSITLTTLIASSEAIVVGLDGGGLDDLYGLSAVGREPVPIKIPVFQSSTGETRMVETRRWQSWSHAWCHRSVLQRRQSIASVLEDFAKDGDLTICDDDLGDIAGIVEIIGRIKDAGKLAGVAADPAGLGETVDALAAIGVTVESGLLVGVPQGYGMMNAIKTGERRLANGTLIHADQPMMDWAVSNLKIEPTATAIRATKQNAGDAKIDPAMALFDAMFLMTTNPVVQGRADTAAMVA